MLIQKRLNKDSLYLSFVNEEGRLVNEYIPRNFNWLGRRIRQSYFNVLQRLGKNHYYWHFRHLYGGDSIKENDIAFILHVLEDHGGKPYDKNEARFYNHIESLYKEEITNILMPYVVLKEEGRAITHPYYQAYLKRWTSNKPHRELKRLYHGIDSQEVRELLEIMMSENDRIIKRLVASQRYYDKKLQQSQTNKSKRIKNIDNNR